MITRNYLLILLEKKNYLNLVELLTDKEFNPFCTLEFPVTYIPPTNIYQKTNFTNDNYSRNNNIYFSFTFFGRNVSFIF